jgi:(E)-4-hydroxy-3-methylbut-2-enyl-diphosphate synthase
MRFSIPLKKTKQINIGNVCIGGNNKIIVQSMCNTDTKNVKATVGQIKKLQNLGCEIVRVSVPDMASAKVLGQIKSQINIPLVADIHFDYKIALEAVKQGVDKIRINPGNIGSSSKVKLIANACRNKNIPIRVGINAGSLSALKKLKKPPRWTNNQWARIMVKEALGQVHLLRKFNFDNIIVSLKADDVERTYLACKLFAKHSNLPQHIGVTESGTVFSGSIKSAVGISRILCDGIGDTIRISLADNPLKEIPVAFEILKSLGLRHYGPEIIACPTCARCEIDVGKIARQLENKIYANKTLRKKTKGLRIAIMGCVVNGPGEAKTADLAITGSKNYAILFKKGQVIKKIKKINLVNTLISQISGLRV